MAGDSTARTGEHSLAAPARTPPLATVPASYAREEAEPAHSTTDTEAAPEELAPVPTIQTSFRRAAVVTHAFYRLSTALLCLILCRWHGISAASLEALGVGTRASSILATLLSLRPVPLIMATHLALAYSAGLQKPGSQASSLFYVTSGLVLF